MYRTPVTVSIGGDAGRAAPRLARRLRLATIGVDQRSRGAGLEPDRGPSLGWVAGLERGTDHTGGDELVEPTRRAAPRAGRNELGDDPPVRGDGNPFSDSAPVRCAMRGPSTPAAPPTTQGGARRAGAAVIVIDASAVLEVLLNRPAGARIADRLFAAGETLHAPHLLDLEVAQVLRVRYPHDPFLPRIWELRNNLTAYDAAYLALAEALPALLVTCDAALPSPGVHGARVEVM
jgi:predicted nucleic acid-binding protein